MKAAALSVMMLVSAGRPAASQYLPVLVRSALSPSPSRVPAAWQDSVRRTHDESLWLLGSLLGAGALGVIGMQLGAWGCSADESCLDDRAKGFLIGAAVGFPLGGIIGDAIHVTPAPDSTPRDSTRDGPAKAGSQEDSGNARRADQPARQAGPVLRLLEPTRRR